MDEEKEKTQNVTLYLLNQLLTYVIHRRRCVRANVMEIFHAQKVGDECHRKYTLKLWSEIVPEFL